MDIRDIIRETINEIFHFVDFFILFLCKWNQELVRPLERAVVDPARQVCVFQMPTLLESR